MSFPSISFIFLIFLIFLPHCSPADRFSFVDYFSSFSGCSPSSSLILHSDQLFYGLTRTGGAGDVGTIFSLNETAGGQVRTVFSFNGNSNSRPFQSLFSHSNGFLYGFTEISPAIFKFSPSNPGSIIFLSQLSSRPATSLISSSNSQLLFGALEKRIFSLDPATDSVVEFSSSNFPGFSISSLIDFGSGILLGACSEDFSTGAGNIFTYTIAANSFEIVYQFSGNDNSGGSAPFSLLRVPSSSTVFGLTAKSNLGTGAIFSYSHLTRNISVLYSFPGSGSGAQIPSGNLL